MAWSVYRLPAAERAKLDEALRDDVVSRQSQTIREAATFGGPSGETYVLVEGSPEGVRRADELLAPITQKVSGTEGEGLYRRFKDEQDQASSGMGLFFTEE